jgi:hypothetical protein
MERPAGFQQYETHRFRENGHMKVVRFTVLRTGRLYRPECIPDTLLLRQGIPIVFNPLNPELNPICYLLALLEAHYFLHVSRMRVKSLTFRLLMLYIYIYIYIYIWSTHS